MELVRSLESKGLVECGRDPIDRRSNAVVATARGVERHRDADVNLEASEFEFFGPLSVATERALLQTLQLLSYTHAP